MPMRLFIALWPDEEVRQGLAALPVAGGRRVADADLHLTLAFLGEQPEAALPQLRALLRALPPQSFTLRIDSLDRFIKRHEAIAWAGPSAPPEALQTLHAGLMTQLREWGFNGVDDAPFIPHITLARRVPRVLEGRLVGAIATPVIWTPRAPVLVRSQTHPSGSRYTPMPD